MQPRKKPRSYSDFTLDDVRMLLGIENSSAALNFDGRRVAPSAWLLESLEKSKLVALNTEKVKSEVLVMPVLMELLSRKPQHFRCFSGNTFDVDAARSLKGRCDFLLTKKLSHDINAPVIAQRRHQRAITATDIEHPAARRDIGGDDRKVWAQGGHAGNILGSIIIIRSGHGYSRQPNCA